ncbi:methyltransferase domain-containing protein [Streptosporangium sp. NPDC049644]|uniref:SAM-dependent methyltransferase n=1 Tax=Streptosporangium sp. NPDC049644 TaxID=3155507 RepID=UPI003415BBFB
MPSTPCPATGSYDYLASLTEKVGGLDLHYGYWSGPDDDTPIEEATDRLTGVVVDRLDARAGELVLDVGCGNGRPAVTVAERTGARVTAIDVDERALERGRAWARERGVEPLVSFERCDALAMPYPDGAFDAVLVFESTPHFAPEPLFAELVRVLRPGGRLVVEAPCLHVPVTGELRPRLAAYFEMFQVHSIEQAGAYVEILRAAGLGVDAVEDLTEYTEPFYRRILERLDTHRAELAAEYGAGTVAWIRDGIADWATIPSGSVLITARGPNRPASADGVEVP